MPKITIDPTKVRNAGTDILSLADLMGDSLKKVDDLRNVYLQSYWYAMGRMDESSDNSASHAEADLFARARATARHRMLSGQATSTASMIEDYDNAATAFFPAEVVQS